MKSSKMRKALTAALAATLMMASTLTVAASGGSAGSSGSAGVQAPSESTGDASESTGGAADSFIESVRTYGAGAQVTVGRKAVKTTVDGAFSSKTVQGMAVITPLDSIKASLGLTGSQTPHIIAFDTDAKKSHLAMKCVNAAAEALGGKVVAALNIDLGAKENGKRITLANGSVGLVVGLPKNADTTKKYSVVCVQPGGVISILEDQDTSPETVTFAVKAGLGTYGIIAR